MIKTSKHSRKRMLERTDFNHKKRRELFREALDYGKSVAEIKDQEIKGYVESKIRCCKIKLYQDYLFIYSKNNKQLYTMYRLPDSMVGKEEYIKIDNTKEKV